MCKLPERKRISNRGLAVAAMAALCLSGNWGGVEVKAAPAPQVVAAQKATMTISGTVKDENGAPLVGANVMERSTTRGIVTDIDGKFTLKVAPGSTIIFSYLGYSTVEQKAASNMDIVLKEDNALLDELVVVGYGQQKRANLTGAVSTVNVDKDLVAKPQMDVAKSLQGIVPGLSVINTQGGIDAQPTLTIRGVGTLSNNETSSPYIIVDGIPTEDLTLINPNDIESVSVLKDAASTSIYGSRAAFGVILITTKGGAKDKVSVNYTNNFSWGTPSILPDYADVPSQLEAMMEVNRNAGTSNPELFGMYFNQPISAPGTDLNGKTMIDLAKLWQQQHGYKKDDQYRNLRPYQSLSDVGDYYLDPATGKALFYADWDVVGINYRDWTPSQSHNINVNGTSGRTSYYLSFGYDKKEGVLAANPDELHRYNVTANIQSNVTDWLQVGARFQYTDRTYTKPNPTETPYQYMWRWGSFFYPYGMIDGVDLRSPYALLKAAADDETHTKFTRMTGYLKANIIDGLTLNADYTYTNRNVFVDEVRSPVFGYNTWGTVDAPSMYSSSSYVYQDSRYNNRWALNVYANYEFNFGKHNFNVMAGGNAEGGTYRMHYSQRRDLTNVNLPELNLASGEQLVGSEHSHWGTAGYFARINYNWNEIWLLELNGRIDGSSSFPANDRWAFFPSGSVGYRFSQENYFEPIRDIVSNGKLRASFGEIGNEAVGNNMYIQTIGNPSSSYWLDAKGSRLTMYDLPKMVSETLTWERIQTADIGLDLGFFNNSLNVTFDWYQRKTLDMLAPGTVLPDVLGADAPYGNNGSLRTRGWELSASWNKQFGDFNVYVSGNVSDFKTVVTEWNNPTGILSDYFSGKVYGDIYGFETDRLFTEDDFTWDAQGNRTGYAPGVANQDGLVGSGNFQYSPGDTKYKDLNNDGKIDGGKGTTSDMGDLKVIGNSTPRFQYGFRLGGSWKGIDIDMYFQGVGKWSQWSTGAFVMPFSRGADGIYENQMDYWTPDNTDAWWPRLYPGNGVGGTVSGVATGAYNFYPQSKYLIDRSYLRFKNLTVGYTLPQNLTKKWYIEKLRVYFTAENLCELINNSFAPVDPEIDSSESSTNANGTWGRITPMMRTISCGLQLTF